MSGVAIGDGLIPARRRLWLYVLGGLVLTFLILPMFIVVPMSFSSSRYLDFPPPGLSLRWYQNYVSSATWVAATLTSLQIAGFTCLLATPAGVAAAYAIRVNGGPLMAKLEVLLLLPLLVPNIILAIGIFFLYTRLRIVGTPFGLVMAHTMHAIPFVVVTTLAGLRHYDLSQEKAALSLGASRFVAFMKVTLPQVKGSVMAGALFAFISSLDEVVIALFNSSGANATLTKVMFTTLRDEIDPTIAAISTIMIVTSLIIALTATLLSANRK